jgi:beta-lactamase class C
MTSCFRMLPVAAVLIAALSVAAPLSRAALDEIGEIVGQEMHAILEAPGGAAVAVRAHAHTWLFNFGMADARRPVDSDVLFNLGSVGKVFDTTLLALADRQGELNLDDPVARYVVELQRGGDVRSITLRQLATYTSGFVLAQDHAPWPSETFTLPQFLAALDAWVADPAHMPGRQMIYSHAGFVLLHLALERRFGMPFDELMRARVLAPLGLASTSLPAASADAERNPRGEIAPELVRRAAQGYWYDGTPIGAPGDLQGYYHWLGTGQMYASARDMAVFLAANLGELADQQLLQEAMRRAQQGVFRIGEGTYQAMAWEVHDSGETVVDKYGGMNNATAYIALMPARSIGIAILGNRGGMALSGAGRRIMAVLAGQ